jgi:RNA polymerase sigma-70 factor (ECF subfamily)
MDRASPVLVLLPTAPASGVEAYFRAYSGYVSAIALRLLGRRQDVDDVVQEVFLAAIESLPKLREREAAKAWLATVTVRVVARRLRLHRFRSFLGLRKPDEYATLTVGATQEQATLVNQVYCVLDTLPIGERIAWTLRYVEGEQLDAVARLCGCSLATAKRRIAAAQEAIQKAVRDE